MRNINIDLTWKFLKSQPSDSVTVSGSEETRQPIVRAYLRQECFFLTRRKANIKIKILFSPKEIVPKTYDKKVELKPEGQDLFNSALVSKNKCEQVVDRHRLPLQARHAIQTLTESRSLGCYLSTRVRVSLRWKVWNWNLKKRERVRLWNCFCPLRCRLSFYVTHHSKGGWNESCSVAESLFYKYYTWHFQIRFGTRDQAEKKSLISHDAQTCGASFKVGQGVTCRAKSSFQTASQPTKWARCEWDRQEPLMKETAIWLENKAEEA